MMQVKTKVFGEIEIAEDKIIYFPNGIIGFPELNRFTLLYDEEKGLSSGIRWLQPIDEPQFAMPVMDPLIVAQNYNPVIEEALLKNIGNVTADNLLVLVTISIPSDITKMSVNLQGPIIVNVDDRKACQIITETDKFPVKYMIFELLQQRKVGE